MAKPSQISAELRKIARGISASKNPDPKRVAGHLRRVLAALPGGRSAAAPGEPQGVGNDFTPKEASVLNQSVDVDIEVDGKGTATVMITQIDYLDEDRWRNVSGTISIDGQSFDVSTSGGKYRDDGPYGNPEADAFFGQMKEESGVLPIDIFYMAINTILAKSGIFEESPTMENGAYVDPEGPAFIPAGPMASELRKIARGISASKNPDPKRVAGHLRRVLAALPGGRSAAARVSSSRTAAGEIIVIYMYGDGEIFSVTGTAEVQIASDFVEVPLEGATVYFATSLDAIKANMDMSNEALLEALNNRGLVQTDLESGQYNL